MIPWYEYGHVWNLTEGISMKPTLACFRKKIKDKKADKPAGQS